MPEMWLESAFTWQFNPIGETNRIDKPEQQLTEKSPSHTLLPALMLHLIFNINFIISKVLL